MVPSARVSIGGGVLWTIKTTHIISVRGLLKPNSRASVRPLFLCAIEKHDANYKSDADDALNYAPVVCIIVIMSCVPALHNVCQWIGSNCISVSFAGRLCIIVELIKFSSFDYAVFCWCVLYWSIALFDFRQNRNGVKVWW